MRNAPPIPIPHSLRLEAYTYHLPRELIAQTPVEPRDAARMLVLDRSTGAISHHHVFDLPSLLRPGDLVVVNRSRVLPCRLIGRKADTGGLVELLLLRPVEDHTWEALVRGRRVRAGQRIQLVPGVSAEIGEPRGGGRAVRFPDVADLPGLLSQHGQIPLPPYIRSYSGDPTRYQTVYADVDGSAAAPTAGLHFTPRLIEELASRGVGWASVVLHIGLDTFRPMLEEDVRHHRIHSEWIDVSADTAAAVAETRRRGGRLVAVGTTTVRALEHAARAGEIHPYSGPTDLFITPGHRFRLVDALLTNFHLPRSSLLLLVSAFAGRRRVLHAYQEAIDLRYRFFSFGDVMLIL